LTATRTNLLAEQVWSSQAADGSFRSLIISKEKTATDHNACITGLVVRALGCEELTPELDGARERALDYLEICERSALPGAFGFWPQRSQPGRPGDADDTAIAAIELYRHRRRSLEWLRHVALRVLMPFRVQPSKEVRPEWIRVGAFLTWLRPSPANVVDVLVNANVLALLALAGLRHVSAYRQAAATVASATTWTGGSVPRTKLVAPYYAHPGEFYRTLEHAVECGAVELQPSLKLVEEWFGRDEAPEENRPVCCAPYGKTVWTAPVLQLTRQIQTNRISSYGGQKEDKEHGSQEIAQKVEREDRGSAGWKEEIGEANSKIRHQAVTKNPATSRPVRLTAGAMCRD
jgi:hypothetical protein